MCYVYLSLFMELYLLLENYIIVTIQTHLWMSNALSKIYSEIAVEQLAQRKLSNWLLAHDVMQSMSTMTS